MKFKINIILIGAMLTAVLLIAGCKSEQPELLSAKETATETPIQHTPEPVATQEIEPQPTPAGGAGIFKNTGNLESFDNLSNLSKEQMDLILSFDYEPKYYRLENEPEYMHIEYLSFWETGFFTDYVNYETEEFYSFKWIGVTEPEEYLEQINEHVENSDELSHNEVIVKDGIDYYIHLFTFEGCAVADGEILYRGEIRWIENGECFYLGIRSRDMIDESDLQYCHVVKYELP